MPIIRNLKKDFEEGRMDNLRSVSYKETGTEAPYVSKSIGSSYNQITKRIDDVARMGKMLINKPGRKHLLHEALLKQGEITKKLEGNNGSVAGNILRRVGGTVKHVAQVAASTIAQVPVNGTGTHFLRAFKTDTYLQDGDPVSGFASFFGAGGIEGTKYAKKGARVPSQGLLTTSVLPKRNTTASPGEVGIDHIGITGAIGVQTDISAYNNITPYYQTTEGTLTGIRNKGIIFANIDSGLKGTPNSTVVPYTLGINKSKTGAELPAGFLADSNPATLQNKFSPTNSTEFSGTTTTGNIIRANKGYPINPGGTIKTIDPTTGFPLNLFIPDLPLTTPLSGSFGVPNRNVDFSVSSLEQKTATVFEIGATKTVFTTPENITAASSQIKVIPLKKVGNETTSPIYLSQPNDFDSGEYDGSVSSLASGKQIQDFRSKESTNEFRVNAATTYSFNYNDETINKEKRVGLGNPGKRTRLRTSYTVDDPDTVDKINALDVSDKPLDGIKENRDLIQLEFQVITPEETHYLAFRAFLDTFDDSFNASWNSSKYLGRADSFYTYNGFERSINIGFKIAAQTREEMKPLYRKAATLASVTAPSYGTGGRFMRGTIAKVTVGDYIYEQPGIIESVQYTWQKDYPWEISFQNPEKEGGKDQILPHVLDVSISFKVIHDFLPEVGVTPFITNHRPIKDNKETYIPLVDRKFIIPETAAEKREKAAKKEAEKKEAEAKEKKEADNQNIIDNNLIGPLQETDSSTGENTNTTTNQGIFGIST